MKGTSKKLTNPISSGGGGVLFEAHVQASFVALMLTGGYAPCLPAWPISKIKLQGKIDGYDTDDLIVFVQRKPTQQQRKLLAQIKRSISFSKSDGPLKEVMQAAWSDFNNERVFRRNVDAIALITGPISALDQKNVQFLLHHAKTTNDPKEFFRNVEQANFSPSQATQKLSVIRDHLDSANGGARVSDQVVYEFLNHFFWLGYDLGEQTGVVLPLLQSHISLFQKDFPKSAWARVVEFVQSLNQHAGTITADSVPEDIQDMFSRQTVSEEMPPQFELRGESEHINWANHKHTVELAILCLVGGWSDANENDVEVICKLTGLSPEELRRALQSIIQEPNSPLVFKSGEWKIKDKISLINEVGHVFIDSTIADFKDAALKVLEEINPAFELDQNERYLAPAYGRNMAYSPVIRQGLSEGVAILSNHADAFKNCSPNKAVDVAFVIVKELLSNDSWNTWVSIERLLPTLAESAPEAFLEQVESVLYKNVEVFDSIFAQEGDGFTGANYMTGILWGLESIAWIEAYFMRACLALAEIAERDPGGNWSNRPLSSLVTILLPWLPQTYARVEKRKAVVQSIIQETPSIGWKLLLQLLPGQHSTSFGSYKPKWKKEVVDAEKHNVSHAEYSDITTFYAELALNASENNIHRISDLIDHFPNLPVSVFDSFLEKLRNIDTDNVCAQNNQEIWDKLTLLTVKHRKFSDAKWSMPNNALLQIEEVTNRFTPVNLMLKHKQLFSTRDFDLFAKTGNWREQQDKLFKKRQSAVTEILSANGISGVIEFIEQVDLPREVGSALAIIADSSIDAELLPKFLSDTESKRVKFTEAFVKMNCHHKGWEWADKQPKIDWSVEQIAIFLSHLPFEKQAWERAKEWLSDKEAEYWQRANAFTVEAEKSAYYAIDKLIEHGRGAAAIDCLALLNYQDYPLDTKLCKKALLSKAHDNIDQLHVIELIKYLQAHDPDTDALIQIEWAYLPILDGFNEALPKTLDKKLASDASFFSELIQLLYRPKGEEGEAKRSPEPDRNMVRNLWSLMHRWQTPPGLTEGREFNEEAFKQWLEAVKEVCDKSGHLEVAMITIGSVLVHSPGDPSGLWINKEVAKALDQKDAGDMRSGFSTGVFNSRGAYTVDPTGKPEKELAEKYFSKAEDLENASFVRFAETLRGIAKDYERQSQRTRDRYQDDDIE